MKHKRGLLISVMSCLCALSLTAACGKGGDSSSSGRTETAEGVETGVYYYDADGEEYLISLNSGNRFTFLVMGENKSGEYALAGDALTLDFALDADGEISASLAGDVLTLTYENSEMRFLKKISYTVNFDCDGGSAVEPVTVINGYTLGKPADPKREGYTFIGWFTDENFQKPFRFNSQVVNSDMTLYAQWAENIPGRAEFTVDFDLNYAAEAPADRRTVGGRLYGVPEPEREGYAFAGWWVSMYDDAERLSYRYDGDTVFSENTTLYALWRQGTEGLSAPLASVEGDSVSWDAVSGAAAYHVRVTDRDNTAIIDTSVGTLSVSVPFSANPAGDYTVAVTAMDAGSGKSDTTTRFYKNKALARVSSFTVVEPSSLVFEGVNGAERYYISVECGNAAHNHTRFFLGSSNHFNFSDCPMTEEGIRFTVTAEADGYAPSVSRTFVYNRTLSAVTGLHFDEGEQKLVWDAVPEATGYILSVRCGDSAHAHEFVDNGSKTSYSLKECAPGEITVKVYPFTKGYNSPVASEYTYTKTALATPRDLRVEGNTLGWTAVSGAAEYEIKIGKETFTAKTNSFDMSEAVEWLRGADYQLSIRALGAKASVWSDPLDVRYYGMYESLSYSNSVLSWRPVVGAVSYEVTVNGGEPISVGGGACAAEIALTKAGKNEISVRFYDGVLYSEAVTIEIYAHTVSFDTRGGSGVKELYKAVGDKIALSEPTKDGYNFAGWYNTPTGPKGNGAQYADETFSESGDIVLYAYWTPVAYDIVYDYDGGSGEAEKGEVVFGEKYTLAVPAAAPNDNLVFTGWYSQPNGTGTQYTDEKGESISPWQLSRGGTAYARWEEILTYSKENDDTYSVTAGPGVAYVSSVTIPAKHNGIDVTIVDAYAFKGTNSCRNILSVNIPNTIKIIYTENAFDGCANLREVNIYEVEGYTGEVFYQSDNGVLIYHDPIAEGQPVSIVYVPRAMTGSYRIPDRVTNIPANAFSGSSLSQVTIPAGVTSIGKMAFSSCKKLVKVEFEEPTSGEEQPLAFDYRIFSMCTALVEVTIPARAGEFLDLSIFSGCSALQKIYVDKENPHYSSIDGVLCNKTGDIILYCPTGKTGVYTVPAGVTTIGASAFNGCVGLTGLVIPNFVTAIEKNAFASCSALVTVTFEGGGSSALTIGQSAFSSCRSLKNIVFADGSRVSEIGADAFYRCVSLASVKLPASVTSVGSGAFEDCTALHEIVFAENGTDLVLGDSAFDGCTALKTITLPSYISEISSGVFTGCTNLEGVKVSPDNPNYADLNGVLFDKNYTELLFYSAAMPAEYELPETVTTIGASVFAGNKNLRKITIGKNVASIGAYAFSKCINLSQVVFKEGGTEPLMFGRNVFEYCDSLTEFTFPDRAAATSSYMFAWAEGLERVTLGADTKTLASYTFWYCLSLTTVNVSGQEAVEGVAVIPEGATEIASNLFGYTAIRRVSIPNTVTAIGNSAFTNCFDLEELVLPAGLETIGSYVFEKTSIKQITVPATVTAIGNGAFRYNDKLKKVTFEEGCSVKTIGEYMFLDDVLLTEIVLPDTVETIGLNAVSNTAIASFIVPAAATSIHNKAFAECFSLTEIIVPGENAAYSSRDGILYDKAQATLIYCPLAKGGSVTIPGTVTKVEALAFAGNSELAEIIFAEGAEARTLTIAGTKAADSAFAKASGLRRVVLPEGLAQINAYTFQNCKALEEVLLPASLTNIGNNAFDGCAKLATVIFAKDSLLTTMGTYVFRGTGLTSFEVPSAVTKLNNYTFANCYSLESVTLSEKLTTLGTSVFQNCSALAEIVVPEGNTVFKVGEDGSLYSGGALAVYVENPSGGSVYTVPSHVTDIGAYAFDGRDFETLIIPKTVRTIGDYAFQNCLNLKNVTFEAGTEGLTIGKNAFYKCAALESVKFPARLVSLGNTAFQGCTALTNVVFPDDCRITLIPSTAFRECSSLTSIRIPANVTELGSNAFRETSLTEVVFAPGNQLQTIGGSAFWGVKTLTSFVIPDTVKAIKSNAFQGTGLTGIVIPEGVTSIENYTFYECFDLETITFLGNITTVGNCSFWGCESLKEISLPAVTSIDHSAFGGCTSLASVELSDALTTLKENNYQLCGIFENCVSLTSIYLPSALTSIPKNAFYGCERLNGVTIPAGVTKIGNYAFFGCSSLTSINIPGSVTSLGEGAFGGCGALETIDLAVDNAGYLMADGILFDIEQTQIFKAALNLEGEYIVPDSVTKINAGAFSGSKVERVVLPDGVKVIGDSAFENCAFLTEVVIPDTVTSIGAKAFRGTALKTIALPGGLTQIGDAAFQNSALERISIPGSVKSSSSVKGVGAYAFDGCTALAEVVFEKSSDKLLLGEYAFRGCVSLKTITLPRRIRNDKTTAGIGNGCFEGCINLKEVLFGAESSRELDLVYGYVLSVGDYAFAGCTALEEIILPDFLTVDPDYETDTVGAYAFKGCISLASVSFETSRITRDVRIGEGAFDGCSGLASLVLSQATTRIGAKAFEGCTSLAEIVIPENVAAIGAGAFGGWTAEQKISVKGKAAAPEGWDESWTDGCLAAVIWNA